MKKHELLLAIIEGHIDWIKTEGEQTEENKNKIDLLNVILSDYEIELEQIALKNN